MNTPTALGLSSSRFMHWGRENAQFLAVGLAFVASISYVGGRYQQLQDQREVFEARIEAARAEAKQQKAEAIQQCNEKFLLYGYADEYRALQQMTLGERAPKDISEKS